MDFNGLKGFNQTLGVRGIALGAPTAEKTIMVNFRGSSIKCRVGRAVTIAAGDIVIAFRIGHELVVLERLHAAAPGTPPDPDTPPPTAWESIQTGTTLIAPVTTRSYRNGTGWLTTTQDLLQGQWGGSAHHGCAFYGTKPKGLVGATVLSATVKVRRDAGSSWTVDQPATLKRIEETLLTTAMVRDKTAPTYVSGTQSVPRLSAGQSLTYDLGVTWGQSFVDGNAGGLSFHTNSAEPKARFDGRASWSQAMVLTIVWQRVI
jgi:hypothetical protein